MSFLVTETPEGLSLKARIAGPGARSLASIMDLGLFLALLYLGVMVAVMIPGVGESLAVWLGMGFGLALMFFQAFCALCFRGLTLGKKVMGLTVVDESGFPASLFQHLARGIFWPLEMIPFPLPIGVLLMAGSAQHQRLGDRVAGTLVLFREQGELPADPYRDVNWRTLKRRRLELVPALSSRFDERDLAFLRELIARKDVEPEPHRRILKSALAHYLKRLDLKLPDEPSAREARAVLSELYVFLRHTLSGA